MEENNIQKLDAIKEIIFGENIKEYDKEFKKLKDALAKQRTDIQSTIKDMKKELFDLLKEKDKEIDKQVKDLRLELDKKLNQLAAEKADRESLANMLIDIGKSLKK